MTEPTQEQALREQARSAQKAEQIARECYACKQQVDSNGECACPASWSEEYDQYPRPR